MKALRELKELLSQSLVPLNQFIQTSSRDPHEVTNYNPKKVESPCSEQTQSHTIPTQEKSSFQVVSRLLESRYNFGNAQKAFKH
jgi:hypothetical protein